MTVKTIAHAREKQNEKDPEGNWRNKKGAPSKQGVVEEWRLNNPDGSRKQCARETGLSINTVRNHWKDCEFDLHGFTYEEQIRRTLAGEFNDKKVSKTVKRSARPAHCN